MFLKIRFDEENGKWFTSIIHEWNADGLESRLNNPTMTNLSFETIEPIVQPLMEHRPLLVIAGRKRMNSYWRYLKDTR